MTGIYLITNRVNGKQYIGASLDIENRWKVHSRIFDSVGDKEYNKTLYKAFRKYGVDNFSFTILEECSTKESMYLREKEWIKKYQTDCFGYNETQGGEAGSQKGHCAGEQNGRAKLSEQDIIDIRHKYANHEYMNSVYQIYKHKVTKSTFQQAWSGRTWSYVMPEVFSEENKKWHRTFGVGRPGEKNTQSKLNDGDVITIRKRKLNNESRHLVYKDYVNRIGKIAFEQIWYNITWKHIIVKENE